jgi:hypothetical protein
MELQDVVYWQWEKVCHHNQEEIFYFWIFDILPSKLGNPVFQESSQEFHFLHTEYEKNEIQ